MNRDLAKSLSNWLAAGRTRIGQIAIRRTGDAFELRHVEDAGRPDLVLHEGADAARALANLDDADVYRPLKTAPNLRHGWRMVLGEVGEVRRALDYFYPAMTAVWRSYESGDLAVVPFRETLARQTGMYRITQKITDEQGRAMIDAFCSGCLKCRLWDGESPEPQPDAIPLLCQEMCNLLVAEARKVVKSQPPV